MNLWTAVSAAVGIKTPTTEKQREGEKVVAMSVEYSQKSLALKGKKIQKGGWQSHRKGFSYVGLHLVCRL